jgi:parallel beta-helix repeat protein
MAATSLDTRQEEGMSLLKGKRFGSQFPRPHGKSRLRLESLEIRTTPSHTLTVDDDHMQDPDAQFTSIQAAVNAAQNGDHIEVFAGTYHEQVIIPSKLNNVDIFGVGNRENVRIAPTNFTADPTTQAVVHVNGARNIDIHNFLITGSSAPAAAANGAYYGVLVDNGGSADVSGNHITTIRDLPLSGNQQGIGVQYGFTDSMGNVLSSGKGETENNLIDDYQKGGVVVIGAQSKAEVEGNTIVGAGPTTVIAQNGIQVSNGAKAEIEDNSVSGNNYTVTTTVAVGILLFGAADNVEIEGNTVFGNNEGILLYFTNRSEIEDNHSHHNTNNGIALFQSNRNKIEDNNVDHNGLDGINIDTSNNNSITDNEAFYNMRYGIALEATSTDNTVRDNELGHNTVGPIFVGNPDNNVGDNDIDP